MFEMFSENYFGVYNAAKVVTMDDDDLVLRSMISRMDISSDIPLCIGKGSCPVEEQSAGDFLLTRGPSNRIVGMIVRNEWHYTIIIYSVNESKTAVCVCVCVLKLYVQLDQIR